MNEVKKNSLSIENLELSNFDDNQISFVVHILLLISPSSIIKQSHHYFQSHKTKSFYESSNLTSVDIDTNL